LRDGFRYLIRILLGHVLEELCAVTRPKCDENNGSFLHAGERRSCRAMIECVRQLKSLEEMTATNHERGNSHLSQM